MANATNADPEVELYAAEELDDEEAGEGIRIYRSDDAVFEARSLAGAEARLYRDDEHWYAKVRFPETDVEDAYNRLITAVEDVNEVYGTALDISPKRFRERVERNGAVSLEEGDLAVHYREETELDGLVDAVAGDPATSSLLKGAFTGVAVDAGVGTAFGAALGALAGPPGVVGGAALGGSVWAAWSLVQDGLEVVRTRRNPYRMNQRDRPLMKWAARHFEERRRDGYRAVDAVADHLDAVNRLYSLAAEVDATREMDMEQHKELDELEERDIEDAHDLLMELHFHRYDEGSGVIAVHETDTYWEAADFITTVTGNRVSRQRPSLYTDPDAFTTLFDHLTYEERGSERYLDDARRMVRNAYDDGSTPVRQWLEATHPRLVEDVNG